MSGRPLYYSNPDLGKADPYVSTVVFNLTYTSGAASGTPKVSYTTLPFGFPVMAWFDTNGASNPSQETIDNFLGSTNEFLATCFDLDTVDNDTGFGMIIRMNGQAQAAAGARASAYQTTGLQLGTGTAASFVPYDVFAKVSNLSAATPVNYIQVGDQGNIAIQFKMTDGVTTNKWSSFYTASATPGQLVVQFYWLPV